MEVFMSVKPSGTREQNAVGEWLDNAAKVRSHLMTTAEKIPAILPFFDSLSYAGACFGRCELNARSLDRAVEMNLFTDQQKTFAADVKKFNEAGIEQVGIARKVLAQLGKELEKAKLDPRKTVARLKDCFKEFRLGIAEWDMKGSDARKLDALLTEMSNVVSDKGLPALAGYLDGKMAELIDVRHRDDRGAVDNIPIWKLIFIAGIIGWFIFNVVYCNAFGCSPSSVVFWWAIYASHLLAFVLFC
jgi:hypothetical protein